MGVKKEHVYTRQYKAKIKQDDMEKKWEWKTHKYDTNVHPHFNEILSWCENGMSIGEMCKRLDISNDYFIKCRNQYPEFNQILQLGERLLQSKVEHGLIQLCTGFKYKTGKTVTWYDNNGKKHEKIEEYDNYQPPNQASIAFFLKNRAPDRWKNEQTELLIQNKDENERKKLFLDMLNVNVTDVKDAEIIEPKQLPEDIDK